MNELSIIRTAGRPPERYADRVVGLMLRQIVAERMEKWPKIKQVLQTAPDGSPEAQRKLVKRLKEACGRFALDVWLIKSAKRGRYTIALLILEGWDPALKLPIVPNDRIPAKPWIVCLMVKLVGKGHHTYDEGLRADLFVTHHALSRLVQRCGAVSSDDLIASVKSIWTAYVQDEAPKRSGYRLRFRVTDTTDGYAVLDDYEDREEEGHESKVVATILDEGLT